MYCAEKTFHVELKTGNGILGETRRKMRDEQSIQCTLLSVSKSCSNHVAWLPISSYETKYLV